MKTIYPNFGPESAFHMWRESLDLFAWWKSMAIICCGLLALIGTAVILRTEGSNIPNSLLLASSAHVACIWLSTAFSKDVSTSIWGFLNQWEGALVLSSYLALALVSSVIFKDSTVRRNATIAGIFSLAAITAIGIPEFFGWHPFYRQPLHTFIFGNSAPGSKFVMRSVREGSISATLLNPNFVGSYAAMVFASSLAFLVISRKRLPIAAASFCIICSWILVLGSHSRAGLLAIACAFIAVCLAMWRRKLAINFKNLVLPAIVMTAISLGLHYFVVNENKPLLERTSDDISTSQPAASKKIRSFNLVGDSAVFEIDGHTYIMTVTESAITVVDSSGKPAQIADLKLTTTKFGNFETVIQFQHGQYLLRLVPTSSGLKILAWNWLHDIEHPRRSKFPRDDFLFSRRGYIWARTLPLLDNKWLIGAGPGVYAHEFPQRDFHGKAQFLTVNDMLIIDRPHSMYLQIAHASGIISLGCFLFIAIGGIVRLQREKSAFKIALSASIIAYLVAGFFNDSSVVVAPLFWIMVGAAWSSGTKTLKHDAGVQRQEAEIS